MRIADDDFTLFGLAPRQALDRAALDARWRELQAEVHPDRFAAEGAAAQRIAMQWAVRVNEAYQRLKDPLRRAAYLCERRGAPIDAERNTAMPSAFLMQQMQWREALADAGALAEVERIDTEVQSTERLLLADVQRRLDDEADAAGAAADVRALMFVRRFRQDIERRLDALDATR
jgi:molecular chaperone HscB